MRLHPSFPQRIPIGLSGQQRLSLAVIHNDVRGWGLEAREFECTQLNDRRRGYAPTQSLKASVKSSC